MGMVVLMAALRRFPVFAGQFGMPRDTNAAGTVAVCTLPADAGAIDQDLRGDAFRRALGVNDALGSRLPVTHT